MKVSRIVFLAEEPSMEVFLGKVLPSIIPNNCGFEIHPFNGKDDLMCKLLDRLRGYASWLPPDWRIVVVVDRDDDDCVALKQKLEAAADQAGLNTPSTSGGGAWQVVNRIAIEELEAWYFGDWEAVKCAYPRAPAGIPRKAEYRNPDAIQGGTWEALERVLKKAGYFPTGLRKIEAARAIGSHLKPERSTSHSFQVFRDAITEMVH